MKFITRKLHNAFSMTPLFEVFRDISIYGITRLISVILGLISIPIFARIMSPDVFGVYSLALLTVTISYRVVNEWSRSSVLRFDAKFRNTDQYDRYISNVFIPPIVLGFLIAGIIIGIWVTSNVFSAYNEYILVSVAVFVLSIIYSMMITLLRIRQKAKKFSVLQVLNRLGALSIGIMLILFFRMGGEGLLYGMLITLAILIPLCFKWTGIISDISFRLLNLDDLRRYLSYGIPLTLFALSAFFMRHTDRYMISYFGDMNEVGLYSFACMLPQRTIEILMGIIALGAFPIIVREWENTSKEKATDITSGLARYHMLFTIPIVTILILFPKHLISIIGTTKYAVAYRAIPLVTIASYFTSFAWFSSIAFNLSTKTRQLLIITICSLLANIGLNLFTVPRWGYQGAAASTMITSILYFSFVFIVSQKWLPWRVHIKTILHVMIASILAGGIAYLLNCIIPSNSIIFKVAIILVYGIAYFSILELEGEFKVSKVLSKFF